MFARRLRQLLREPIWFALAIAIVLGALVGAALAHEPVSEAAQKIFGRPWRGDSGATREMLAALLGFEVTIVTIIVSVNVMIIKGAAYQTSPRLIPLYLKGAPLRRSLPLFAFLAAYILGAGRELGMIGETADGPRLVVLGAFVALVVALVFVLIDLFRTFRFVRVERVLGLVRDATFAAAKRIRGRVERLHIDGTATLPVPRDASALVASESGYLVDIDMRRLTRLARDAGVRARVGRAIGEYVDKGEVIGWVTSDHGAPVSVDLAEHIVRTLEIRAARELAYDPALGIRIIVDVANRSLSSSSNDPYTARQALDQLRSVLHHVGRLPHGDWNVVESDGAVRVSVMATHLRELLSLSICGPLYYGVNHPEIIEGLFAIALEVGSVARDPEDRAAARATLERIEDIAGRSDLDASRLARLRAEAEPVRRALAGAQTQGPPG